MSKTRFFHQLPIVIPAVTCVLVGCTAQEVIKAAPEKMRQYESTAASAAVPAAPVARPGLRHSNTPWLGSVSIEDDKGVPLPTKWELDDAVKINTAGALPLTLAEIASNITQYTHIPVRLTDGAGLPPRLRSGDSSGATGGATGQSGTPPGSSPLPQQIQLLTPSGLNGSPTQVDTMSIQFKGKLSTFLDMVASRFGVAWDYRDGVIKVFRYRTRVYTFPSVPGTNALSASTGSSGNGSGSSSGGSSSSSSSGSSGSGDLGTSSNSVNATANLDYFSDLKNTITAMLPPDGTVSVAPSTGQVTVTAPPEASARIADYVQREIARASRQVAVTVRIWSIDAANNDDYGLNFVTDYAMRNGLNLSFGGPSPNLPDQGLSNLSVGVLSPAPAGAVPAIARLAGSNISTQALSGTTNASIEQTVSVVIPNNRIVPWTRVTRTTYIGSSQTTLAANVGSTTSVQASTIDAGYQLVFMPRIQDDGGIWLFFASRVTDLVSLNQQSLGGTQIGLPVQTERSTIQQFLLRSGSTLVIAGAFEDNDQSNARGVGTPWFWGLGGGLSGSRGKKRFVYMITPVEIDTMAERTR